MSDGTGWSPLEKVLYTSLVPLAAMMAVVTLLTFFHSGKQSTPTGRASPASRSSRAEDAERARRDAVRKTFDDCLKGMGASVGRSRVRSRFSAPPNMNKIRDAIAFCRNLIEPQGTPAPAPHGPATLPVA